MTAKELTRLIEAHLDGHLTEAEAQALSRELADHPAARRQFWDQAATHGLMQEAARLTWLKMAAPEAPPKIARIDWSRWRAPLAAAAAFLILGLVWWLGGAHEQPSRGVAVLARAVGAEWETDENTLSPGAGLSAGILRLKAGAAAIEFYSGARVVLEAPAEFKLVSANEGFLNAGKLAAHVPPQARGFKVGSSSVTVVDRGTEFGIAIFNRTNAEVHVFAGRVEVTAAGSLRALNSGEAVSYRARAWQSQPARPDFFLGEAGLAEREAALRQQRLAAWRAASRALNDDPATVIHYTFDAGRPADRTVTNLAASAAEASHGSIVGCTWAEGRWPGKPGLSFRGESDRVRLTAASPMNQVTFLAWVWLEAVPRNYQSLLSAEADAPGCLRWELIRGGRLRLGIARDLGNGYADWEAVNSRPLATPGHWQMLATTFDGTTVRHYCDGEPAGEGASFRPPALHVGAADLGNLRSDSLRHLQGRVDEFALLSRALSTQEIRDLYHASRQISSETKSP